jgi:hypothetical protein
MALQRQSFDMKKSQLIPMTKNTRKKNTLAGSIMALAVGVFHPGLQERIKKMETYHQSYPRILERGTSTPVVLKDGKLCLILNLRHKFGLLDTVICELARVTCP